MFRSVVPRYVSISILIALTVTPAALADIREDTSPSSAKGARREQFERYIFASSADGKPEMPFVLYAPKVKKGTKLPLVVYLHDNGKRTASNGEQADANAMSFVGDAEQKKNPCFVVVPLSKDGWLPVAPKAVAKRKLSSEPEAPFKMTYELIEELIKVHAIDADRVYIVGRGMGASGALAAAAYKPGFFAAVAASNPEIPRDAAAALKTIPVVLVGDKENTDRVKEIKNELAEAGNKNVEVHEGAETGAFALLFKHKREK